MSCCLLLKIVSIKSDAIESCQKPISNHEEEEEAFKYQTSPDIQWSDDDKELWSWLRSQSNSRVVTFCNADKTSDCTKEGLDNSSRPLQGPFPCPSGLTDIEFKGSLDKNGMPKGHARFTRDMKNPKKVKKGVDQCFKLQKDINQISASFVKGHLEGKGSIYYSDRTILEVTFSKGHIQGRVRLFDPRGNIQAIGLYENSVPHGPFWLFSGQQEEQFVQFHFYHGHIQPENVILIDADSQWGLMGRYVNGSYLEHAKKIDLDWSAEYKCMRVVRIPKSSEDEHEDTASTTRLPIKITTSR